MVAGLGQQLDFVDRADRLHAQPQQRYAQFVADVDQLLDMLGEFAMRAMDGLALLAGKLDLAARLDRNRGALALKRQDPAVLLFGLPTEALGEPPQHVLDAAGAGEGQGAAVASRNRDLLVLGADPPILARLAAALDMPDQIVFALNRFAHKRTRALTALFSASARPSWTRARHEARLFPAPPFRAAPATDHDYIALAPYYESVSICGFIFIRRKRRRVREPMAHTVLAIDQGTTGTTVFVLDETGRIRGRAYGEIRQFYPRPGWVEHDPEEIYRSVIRLSRKAIVAAKARPADLSAIGITNQRETFVVWERKSGRPIHRAIVWQCRRSAEICDRLRDHEAEVTRRTGLLLDPYFSGTKLKWLLDEQPTAAQTRGAR